MSDDDNFENLVTEMKAMIEKYGHADCRFALEVAQYQQQNYPSENFAGCTIRQDDLDTLAALYSSDNTDRSSCISIRMRDLHPAPEVSRNAMCQTFRKRKQLCEQENEEMRLNLELNYNITAMDAKMLNSPPFSSASFERLCIGGECPTKPMNASFWDVQLVAFVDSFFEIHKPADFCIKNLTLAGWRSDVHVLLERWFQYPSISYISLEDIDITDSRHDTEAGLLQRLCQGLQRNNGSSSSLRTFKFETGNDTNTAMVWRDDEIEQLLCSLRMAPTLEKVTITRTSNTPTRLFGVIADTLLQSPSITSSSLKHLEIFICRHEDDEDYWDLSSLDPINGWRELTNALGRSNISRLEIETDRPLDLEVALNLFMGSGCPIQIAKISCSQCTNGYATWFNVFGQRENTTSRRSSSANTSLTTPSKIRYLRIIENDHGDDEWREFEPTTAEILDSLNFWLPLVSSEKLPYLSRFEWGFDCDWQPDYNGDDYCRDRAVELKLWLERNRVGRALLMPSVVSDGMPIGFYSVVLEHAARRRLPVEGKIPYDGIYFMVQGLVGGGYISGGRGVVEQQDDDDDNVLGQSLLGKSKRPRLN